MHGCLYTCECCSVSLVSKIADISGGICCGNYLTLRVSKKQGGVASLVPALEAAAAAAATLRCGAVRCEEHALLSLPHSGCVVTTDR